VTVRSNQSPGGMAGDGAGRGPSAAAGPPPSPWVRRSPRSSPSSPLLSGSLVTEAQESTAHSFLVQCSSGGAAVGPRWVGGWVCRARDTGAPWACAAAGRGAGGLADLAAGFTDVRCPQCTGLTRGCVNSNLSTGCDALCPRQPTGAPRGG
jgi:hypothetical protein